jgi:hypothetical protein
MGRMRRWFGKEHNPRRAQLVRESLRLTLPADGVVIAGVVLWLQLSPFAGAPLIVVALVMFGRGIAKGVAAFREPHWDSPRAAEPS